MPTLAFKEMRKVNNLLLAEERLLDTNRRPEWKAWVNSQKCPESIGYQMVIYLHVHCLLYEHPRSIQNQFLLLNNNRNMFDMCALFIEFKLSLSRD